jgi:hypothetical protein
MAQYTLASQLLRPGEIGLFIFTKGDRLELRADGSGSTGDWTISPTRHIDWVCIYRRDRHDASLNELFKGRPAGVERSPRNAAKSVIHLSDVILMGDTDVTWRQFAAPGRGSIRYVTAASSKTVASR